MRDFLTQNTYAPSTSYPYGQGRDTNGTLGTWISNETWADLIHSLHKIANFADEAPDNTQDKNTATNSNTIHNQQLIDAFAKFMFKVFGNNWKDRLNSDVIDELRARNIILLVEGIENNLCFVLGDWYLTNYFVPSRGNAGDQNYFYINRNIAPNNTFRKFDSIGNLIDSYSWVDSTILGSNIRIHDKANDKILYTDESTGLIYDFVFEDYSIHNTYTANSSYFATRLICDNGIIYVLDSTALEIIIFSSFSRLEITRYSIQDNGYLPTSIGVFNNTIFILRNNSNTIYFEHYEINGSISLVNEFSSSYKYNIDNERLKLRIINGFLYIANFEQLIITDYQGNILFTNTSVNNVDLGRSNISIVNNKLITGGTSYVSLDLNLTLNSAGI